MKKRILVPALLGVMGIGGAFAVYGQELVGFANNNTTTSKILTLSEIEKKALTEVNGTIKDINFKKEGSNNYYDVDIITANAEYELKFDALTGELLENQRDILQSNRTTNTVTSTQTNDDTSTNSNHQPMTTHSSTRLTKNTATASNTATHLEDNTQTPQVKRAQTQSIVPKTSMKAINDDRHDNDRGPGDEHNDKEKQNRYKNNDNDKNHDTLSNNNYSNRDSYENDHDAELDEDQE